ncbi:MAG: hypothetical protein Q4P71_05050 [Actinomycetaceae bacterium]|nr:hypothetical protein [Actinomycetaceae bacterium]
MTTSLPKTEAETDGFYDRRGWTTDKKIRTILRPFLTESVYPWLADQSSDPHVLADYEPFHGLTATAAKQLLDVLPLRNLAERQNFAPTCETLLRAAIDNPETVELVGYAIGPNRRDERVSIEGLIYYADRVGQETNPTTATQRTRLWNTIRRELELETARLEPDELHRFRPAWNPKREGWWVWWD